MLVQQLDRLSLNSHLADIPSHDFQVDIMTLGKVVKEAFDECSELPGVMITADGKIIGMISRIKFFEWLSRRYGLETFLTRPIQVMWEKIIAESAEKALDAETLIQKFLLLSADCTINEAAELALVRPETFTYEPIVILWPGGKWRLLDIRILLLAQSRLFDLAKQAADTANKAKSEFLANMSHELRTPLNSVIGFAQIVSKDTSLKPEQQQRLKIINRSGEHLLSLINNILEMSKIEAGQITLHETDFDFHTLLQHLQDMFALQVKKKGLQLILETDSHLPQYISADEGKLRQVLINLIGNGVKFTEKGKIILRAKVDKAQTDNQYQLELEVEDTGLGIAAEEMNKLFLPFEQTTAGRKIKQGTGLGLAITHKFVMLMGGNITIRSIVGVGSCFQLSIPIRLSCSEAFSGKEARGKAIALAPEQPNYRILVVDDETDNRLLLLDLLKSVGFSVQQASNGREAIDIWQAWHPHLILMNLQMPEMDGYEATKQIRRWELELDPPRFPTQIIALTASVFPENRELVLASGFNDYMVKPFQEEVMWQKISQYLGVELIYQQSAVGNGRGQQKTICSQEQITSADLSVILKDMPSQWLAELHQASSQLRGKKVMQLIQDIPPEKAAIAAQLQIFAENYQFEQIVRLLNFSVVPQGSVEMLK